MTSGSRRTPAIVPDDDSVLTPDVTEAALQPEPAPTGTPPNVGTQRELSGEEIDRAR